MVFQWLLVSRKNKYTTPKRNAAKIANNEFVICKKHF